MVSLKFPKSVFSLEFILPSSGYLGFPGGLDCKESACNAGDSDLIPGLERSPGEGNGNPLQYSCLENPTFFGIGVKTDLFQPCGYC